MVKGLIIGQMEENMWGNIKKIKKMDLEYIIGLMEKDIKDNGLMVKCRVKEKLY